ncbi:MAG: hypothetical protein KDA53_04055 [Hyphomonas sp.]|nr:hypothetical protein [Hyphomonas sp.]
MACPVSRFGRSERGNALILFAMFAPVALMLLALAIDIGAVGVKKRELQGATDIAAILAAQEIGTYRQTALANLAANGFETGAVNDPADDDADTEHRPRTEAIIVRGTYIPDPNRPAPERFTANTYPVNAVKVTATHEADLFFAAGFMEAPDLTTTSVAYFASEAGFTVGTRLAAVRGGVANMLLNELFGTEVSLSAMDYRALLRADAALFPALDALSTRAGITAVTYDDILQGEVTLSDLALSLVDGLPPGDAARTPLSRIAADPAMAAQTLELQDLVDLGAYSASRPGTVSGPYALRVRALDMLTAGALLAGGEHQIELDLGASLPGLAGLTATLQIGERPKGTYWLAVSGDRSARVHTAQARLLLDARIDGASLLMGSEVRLPLYVELAAATAEIGRVSCPGGREAGALVDILVTPSLAHLRIADVTPETLADFDPEAPASPAQLFGSRLLAVRGRSSTDVGSLTPQTVRFTADDILRGRIRTVASRDLVGSATGSLITGLELQVSAGGLSLYSPSRVQSAIAWTVAPVTDELDEVLESLLALAGLSLGEADVRASGLHCKHAVLVQ